MTAPAQPQETGPAGKSNSAKADRRKQSIIAAASVLGILLTYMLYRRSKATASGATGTGGGIGSGSTAASQQATDDQQTQSALGALTNSVGALVATLTPSTDTVTAPTPIASTLTAPSASKNFIQTSGNRVEQVQSDGSLLWLNPTEWANLVKAGAKISDKGVAVGGSTQYTVGQNLATINTPAVVQPVAAIHENQQVP